MTNILTSADSLQATNIIINLEIALAAEQSIIAMGINNCIKHKTPALKIIREIKEMARDNYKAVEVLMGTMLLETILNFKEHV